MLLHWLPFLHYLCLLYPLTFRSLFAVSGIFDYPLTFQSLFNVSGIFDLPLFAISLNFSVSFRSFRYLRLTIIYYIPKLFSLFSQFPVSSTYHYLPYPLTFQSFFKVSGIFELPLSTISLNISVTVSGSFDFTIILSLTAPVAFVLCAIVTSLQYFRHLRFLPSQSASFFVEWSTPRPRISVTPQRYGSHSLSFSLQVARTCAGFCFCLSACFLYCRQHS